MFCRWAAVALPMALAAAVADEVPLAERRAKLAAEYVAKVESLADELEGMPAAAQLRRWIAPRKSGRTVLFLADSKASDGADGSTDFQELRETYGANVFDLAAEAAGTQQGELALRLLFEAIHENPKHSKAQGILGLRKSVMRVPRVMQVPKPHPKFGWKGGRHWTIETPHFTVETDSSSKDCGELGRELELLHDVWVQVFFPLWSQDRLVAGRFASDDIEFAPKRRFHVVLFKDRAEYAAQIAKAGKAAAMSSGFYSDEEKLSLFFAGPDAKKSTRYHEVTHQLIQEYLGVKAGVAKENGIWLVEAAALYMESLVFGEGYALLGGYDAENMQFARFRARGGDFLMPLSQLSSLGRDALQEHRDIKKIYGQMGGLGQFFMEGREGQLRPAFIKTLFDVYQGKAEVDTLSQACGASYDELDRDYYEFLNVTNAVIERTPPLRSIRGLSLRKTSVTDAGLVGFSSCDHLQWLDLSLTAAGDGGFRSFPVNKHLDKLFLEQTKISDASLTHLVEFSQLTELYLSGTAITDEGVASLALLKKLKLLDLQGCPITDACLPTLATFKELESLDVSGTRISPVGLSKLKKSLPRLKD